MKAVFAVMATCLVIGANAYVGPYSELWAVTDVMDDGRFVGIVRVPIEETFTSGWKLTIRFNRVVRNREVIGAVIHSCNKKSRACQIRNLPGEEFGGAGDKIEFEFIGETDDGSLPKMEFKFNGKTYGRNPEPTSPPAETNAPSNETTEAPIQLATMPPPIHLADVDYLSALSMSLKFLEAQRSGFVNGSTRLSWKRNSGLYDGGLDGVDLIGGYNLRGGYVKFNYPTAFALTQLAWGGIVYWDAYVAAGEVDNLLEAIKWGTDYLLKCVANKDVLYSRVGSPSIDHANWESASNMNWERPTGKVTKEAPGSDFAGEVAAALSAASMLFRGILPKYVDELEQNARVLFTFADSYRGKYPETDYPSTGYMDELVWAALWIYKSTGKPKYLRFAEDNYHSILGSTSTMFNYDDKTLGVQILMAELTGNATYLQPVFDYCDTPGGPQSFFISDGLLATPNEHCPVHLASNAAFICSFAALLTPLDDKREQYNIFIKSQINRILGARDMQGYMVGFGSRYPKRAHHRDSSCPLPPAKCGWYWYHSFEDNAFLLEGAIVGGPSSDGSYSDERQNWQQNQPNLLFNAPFQSVLAYLLSNTDNLDADGSSQVEKATNYFPAPLAAILSTAAEQVLDGCISNPCLNGGKCKFVKHLEIFCSCPFNTFGRLCENKFEPEMKWVNNWGSGAELYIHFSVAFNKATHRLQVVWPKGCKIKEAKVWDTCLIMSQTSLEDVTMTFQQIGWYEYKEALGMTFQFADLGYEPFCTDTENFRFEMIPIDNDTSEYENYTPENCPKELPVPPPTTVPPSTTVEFVTETIPPMGIVLPDSSPAEAVTDTPATDPPMKPLVEWVSTYGHGGQAHINIGKRKPNQNGGWVMIFQFPSHCKVVTAQIWNGCVIKSMNQFDNGIVAIEQVGWQLYNEYIGGTIQFQQPTSQDCFDSDLYTATFQDLDEVQNENPDICLKNFTE